MRGFHDLKIYGIGKIGPKGQVVIPADARKALSMDPGEKVVILNVPHKEGLTVVSEESFNKHLSHMKSHFGHFDDLVNEYEKHLKDESADA